MRALATLAVLCLLFACNKDEDGDGFKADVDCNDADEYINPDAVEVCDNADNDCDGQVDEADAIDATTWYEDSDGDNYGDAASSETACTIPAGFADDATDCDDGDADVNPGQIEVCDGKDNDCSGTVDDDAVDAETWYDDGDGDGYGDPGDSTEACEAPAGHEDNDDDCDDSDRDIHPGATEVCDGVDNDCNSSTSESGTVAVDGAGSYSSIMAALSAAAPGATVQVCAGTYREQVSVGRRVTIRGVMGAASTTIDARGGGSAIAVTEGGDLTVEGLTLTGGTGSTDSLFGSYKVGGGVYVYQGDATISDSVITLNRADFGGGVFAYEGGLTLEDVVVSLNTAGTGGGLYYGQGTYRLTRVDVEDNAADLGGGLVAEGAVVQLDQSAVTSNEADQGGGLMGYTDSEYVNLGSSVVRGNAAGEDGGGAYLIECTLDGLEIFGNSATWGGGLTCDGCSVEDADIHDNSATNFGGAAYAFSGSFTGCDLDDNTAAYAGGVMVHAGTVTVATSSVTGNTADEIGGGAIVYDGGVLRSTRSDWGTSSQDNDPDDVFIDSSGSSYDDYGTNESFSCSDVHGTCS